MEIFRQKLLLCIQYIKNKKYQKFLKFLLTNLFKWCIVHIVRENKRNARVAQLVERDLAKVEAAGSSPVSRSEKCEKTDTRVSVFLRFSERWEVDEKPPGNLLVEYR